MLQRSVEKGYISQREFIGIESVLRMCAEGGKQKGRNDG
jgi:hypothetical protein